MSKMFLGSLMEMEYDHLKDTQMLIDMSTDFMLKGEDKQHITFILTEAKQRLDKYFELKEQSDTILATYPKAQEGTYECMCCEPLEEMVDSWVQKMHNTIERRLQWG